MNGPVSGAMYQRREHRPSDDDREELRGSLDHAIQSAENLRGYLTLAHRQHEEFDGYGGIARIRDGIQFEKVINDLTVILDALGRRR